MTTTWTKYRRANLAEMRPAIPGEDFYGVSISGPDAGLMVTDLAEFNRGFIARNPQNHADQWYVARAYFDANFEPVGNDIDDAAMRLARKWAELKGHPIRNATTLDELEDPDFLRDLARAALGDEKLRSF